jgi:outer membrane protein insertion porin family
MRARSPIALLALVILWPLGAASIAFGAADPLDGKKIVSLKFQGNRKTESDAIRLNVTLLPGQTYTRDKLRGDLRAIWEMGYFDDVRADAVEEDGGVDLVFVVREKPTIHKIYVAGAKEVGLDKINEVLDLRKDTILDLAKVKRNVEKVRDLYIDKGFYLAEVSSSEKRLNANEVDVYINVDEHAKVEVRRISFIGNRAVRSDELRGAIGTQEGGWLSFLTSSGTYKEEAFDRDLLLLTAFYYDRGYINVKIGKPEIDLSADKEFLYITIPIDEGPQYHIGKLDFKGDLVAPKPDYYKRLSVKTGETFNRSKLGNDIIKLNDLYKDKGYAYVNITPLTQIENDSQTVDLTFDIQRGQKVFFERINIRGNTKTRDKVIRRELKVYEGELYNQSLLDFSKRRVQALGFFEKVELSTRRGSGDDKIEVNIEVTERPTGTFQVGAGFSSVENFIGQAQVSQNNLFGRGQTLTLQAQVSSLRQLFSLRFLDPYFFDTNITFAFSLYNSLLYYPSFHRTARGGDLTWGYLISDNVRLLGTYKLEYVTVDPNQAGQVIGGFAPTLGVNPGTLANLFGQGWTSAIRGSINWDTRNDRMFPTKGVFMSASAEVADPYLASQNTYARFTGFARFYYPIWGPFIFRANLEAGYVTSRTAQGVPIYERYLIGGINTVRGFTLFGLGPKVSKLEQTSPIAFQSPINIGGNLQLISNFEIEVPIFPQVQIKGVVFFDAGNSFNTESKWCAVSAHLDPTNDPCTSGLGGIFGNLRTSVGFGFRWFSPIGPLRFEWGIPLHRLNAVQNGGTAEDPIVFEFTIGNFF